MHMRPTSQSTSLIPKCLNVFLSVVLVVGLSPTYSFADVASKNDPVANEAAGVVEQSQSTQSATQSTQSVDDSEATTTDVVDSEVLAADGELVSPVAAEALGADTAPDFVARNVVTALSYSGGTGSEDDPFLISNEADLVALSTAVNSGESQSGGYFKLASDIEVTSADWAPIGIFNSDTEYPFAGTFDGDGHSVMVNYKRSSDVTSPTGLFGYVKGTGISRGATTIKNVVVKGSLSSSQSYLGGIAGYAANAVIENCRNEATLSGLNHIGGIVGTCLKDGFNSAPDTVIIRRCHNAGEVSGTTRSYGRIGGIIGAFGTGAESEVTDCLNTGSVTGKGTMVGGIAGYWYCASSGSAYMDNCLNTGVITGSNYSGSAASIVASFGGSTSGSVNNYITNVHSQVSKVYAGTALTGTVLGYYYSNTSVSDYGLITNSEMPLAATSDMMGKFFAQTETAPVLRWEAPLNPTVGKVSAEGLTDGGGLNIGDKATFTVDARLPQVGDGANGTMSYAWYRSTSTQVDPATDTRLAGDAKSIEATVPASGTYYFYCVATNTLNGESASLTSELCEVTAISGVEPATPTITTQPLGGVTEQEGDEVELSVAVDKDVVGIGTLSYQWYEAKADTPNSADDQAISGATDSTFKAPATYAGTYRYYCVVTNDFDLVKLSTTSSVVTVEVKPTEISTAEELFAFAARVNGPNIRSSEGDNVAGKTFVLTADIDLGDTPWTPIGTYYDDSYSFSGAYMNEFSGIFDGQGHTITGLNVATENLSKWHTSYAGLFGYTKDATVHNLSVEGCVNTSAMRYVGGIVGYAAGSATLDNLAFKGDVTASSRVAGVVGFVGQTNCKSFVTGCVAQGKVTASAYAGGVVGVAGNTAVANCYNWAEIDCPSRAAGIVGSVSSSSSGYNLDGVSIGNCYNVGKIDAEGDGDEDTTDYYGAIVSDCATTYPSANYYLDSSCSRDAYMGFPDKNKAMTSADMRSAAFVSTLNAACGSDSPVFASSTTGGFPRFVWEKQPVVCPVSLSVTPQEASGAEVSVYNDEGVEQFAAVVEGDGTGIHQYYLPVGTYKVVAKLYGYTKVEFELVVDQADEPISQEIAMQEASKQNVLFDVSAADGVSTASAMLWLDSEEHGSLYQGVRKASVESLELPVGVYTYTWILSGHMSVSGSFEVTEEGSTAGTIIREGVELPVPAAWSGSSSKPVQNDEGYYLVTSGEELAWCAQRVNSGNSHMDMLLMAEIILNDSDNYVNQWTPIGTGDYGSETYDVDPFEGDFNGQGYTIQGLYIDNDEDYQGLFGVIGGDATFENFIVSGFVRTSGEVAAGVASFVDTANATFTNVGNEVNVSASAYVGGIVGKAEPGTTCAVTLKYCYNKGRIIGTMATNYEADYAGGLVGSTRTGGETNLVINSCYNTGEVVGLAHTAGGIIGTGSCTIDGVYNTGTVKHYSTTDGYVNASGAIIGMWIETSTSVAVKNASYFSGSNPRDFGYESTDPSATAIAFDGPEYFTTAVLADYDGFATRYGSSFNDGYPYLSWENVSRERPVVPSMPGSAENPYVISTPEDLVAMSENVAAGHSYAAEYVVLANDIDMDGVAFNSIGTYRNSKGSYFSGNFDGQGHCIANLSISSSTTSYETDEGAGVGLFGHTRNATITHLEVTGEVSGTIWVGGIVGYGYATHVTNCLSRVNVSATSYEEGDGQGIYAGGIVGQSYTDFEGGGSVTGCAYFGTSSEAAITTLSTSKATVAGNYYLSSKNTCGTDAQDQGATGVDSLDTRQIAWALNTLDGTQPNDLIWGLGNEGLCFCDGVDVLPAYRVLLDESVALLSASPEYRLAGEGATVTIDAVKKGYDLTSGIVVKTLSELGTYETIYTGATPGEIPASYSLPAIDADMYVSVNATFDSTTDYTLTTQVVSTDDGSDRSATVRFYNADGTAISTARKGDVVKAVIESIDEISQYKEASAFGYYDETQTSTVGVDLAENAYGREFEFVMPDADTAFEVVLEAKGTLPTKRDESLDIVASAFHVANAAYSNNGTLLNADFIVDDDGTAGITTYYYNYPQQAISTIYRMEGGLTSADYYSQWYSSLDGEGNRFVAQYTGIDIERYLTKWCGMSSDLSQDTAVTFINADGESVTLTVGDLRGLAYSSYQIDGSYVGDFMTRGLPVLLAAGVNNEAFNPDELGPLCLVVGQRNFDEVGGGVLLSDVRKIVVGNVENAQTITHNAAPYSDYLDDTIKIDVRRSGELVGSYTRSVSDIESYVAAHPESAVSQWVTGTRFGEGGVIQYTQETDHYQGINIWDMLLSDEELGLTEYDLLEGKALFYEEPTSTIDPQYSFIAETSLAYLAGTSEGGYAANKTMMNNLETTGVEPVLATAKNGLPLVKYNYNLGYVEDEYNYRGPFIAVLPYNEQAGVVVAEGGDKDAYISAYFGCIVLDLGEACDKTDLTWLVDAVNKDMTGFVASEDGSGVASDKGWVATNTWTILAKALSDAETLIDSSNAKVQEVNDVYDALIAAWQVSMDERHETTNVSMSVKGWEGDALAVAAPASEKGELACMLCDTVSEAVCLAQEGTVFAKEIVTTEDSCYVADEILVVFDEETSQGHAYSALSSVEEVDEDVLPLEISTADLDGDCALVTVKLDEGVDVLSAVEEAKDLAGVAYAQPNFVYTALENDYIDELDAEAELDVEAQAARTSGASGTQAARTSGTSEKAGTPSYTASSVFEPNLVPNDPALSVTTPSSSTANAWHLDSINAFEAWDVVRTNKTVTVAVLDTGCNLSHEELAGQVWQDYAYNAYLGSALTKDYKGHGTHVAGLVAAQAGNGVGTAGASYNAMVLPISVFDTAGEYCYTTTLVKAYTYLLSYADTLNIHVVNMSLGGYGSLDSVDYALMDSIAAAKDKNIVTVASGGNGDNYGNPYTKASYPSDFEDCVSVTALSTDGSTPTTWCDYNDSKDICAPGQNVYSTYYSSSNSYKVMSGTSMAAPIVAGSMALLWAADPNLTVDEAKELIYDTAAPLTVPSGREGKYGAGILDISAAVRALSGIVISNADTTVFSGDTLQMTCRSANGTSVEGVEWSVVDGTGSATIDASTGLLSALMPGTVTVSVRFANMEEEADTVTVAVKPLEMGSSPKVAPGETGLGVSWEANSLASGYILERSEDGATWNRIETLGADILSYLDEAVTENCLYYYRVTPFSSVSQEGTGVPSDAGCSMRLQLITLIDEETSLATSDEALALAVDVFWARGVELDALVLVPDSDDAWFENAAALSRAGNGYVVAVGEEGLSEEALADVARLAPDEIIVLGSMTQISDEVVDGVARAASSEVVTRVSGETRAQFDVSAAEFGLDRGAWGDTVVVSSPSHMDEAYAAAGYSQNCKAPILLTKDEAAPFAASTLLTAKHFKHAIVLGDSGAVKTSAEGYLSRQGLEVERVVSDVELTTLAQRGVDQGNASFAIAGVNASSSAVLTQIAASLVGNLGGVILGVDDLSLASFSTHSDDVEAVFVFGTEDKSVAAGEAIESALSGSKVAPGTFTVGNLSFAGGYILVTFEPENLPAGTGVSVAGTSMMRKGDSLVALLPKESAATLVAEDFVRCVGDPRSVRTDGDVSGNGCTNIIDAQVAYDIACGRYDGFTSLPMGAWLAADVNGSGCVDASDARAIQYAVHHDGALSSSLP
jgi:subtilisin family serine protease